MSVRSFLLLSASLAAGLLSTTATAQDCSGNSWTAVTPVNTARSRTGLAFDAVTGHFFLAGGEATGGNRDIPIERYDPIADTWTNQTNLLTGVSNTGAVAAGGFVYVPGGWNGTAGLSSLQRFDPGTNSVANMAALPGAVAANAVALRGNFIHVVGGSPTGAAGTTHYIYDIGTDTWSTGAPLPVAVQYPTAVSDGALVYVLGGQTTNLTDVQVYDPGTDSWSAGTPMGTGRGGPGAFFDGTNIWAVGGGWSTYLTSTEFSVGGGAWTPGPALITGARTIGVAFGAGMAIKAAGWNGGYLAAAERLDCPSADADLSVTKSGTATGPMVTWTIQVTNNGPGNATGVVVTDPLAACSTYVSDTCGGSNVPPWTWNVGALANGASAVCTIEVDSSACAGSLQNVAAASADQGDPVPGNNSGSAVLGLLPAAQAVPILGWQAILLLVLVLGAAGMAAVRRHN